MSGEQLLQENGNILHMWVADKATDEYKKYKAKTLDEAEIDDLRMFLRCRNKEFSRSKNNAGI